MRPALLVFTLLASSLACAKKKEPTDWDIASTPSYPRRLDTTLREGTWMSVDVHPEGQRLVFDLLGDLYTLPIEGGQATRLTSGPAWDQDPRYAPDGRRLLFVSDRGGNQELHLLDLASGEARPLTKGSPERFVEGAWSPDGRWILARKRITDTRSIGMCELWLVPVDGGEGLRLTQTGEHPFPNEATFSSDGRAVYFSSTPWRFQYGRDPNAGIFDLHRLDLATGEVVRLTGEAGSAFRPTVNPRTGELALLQRKAGDTVLTRFDPLTGARVRVGDLVLEHDNQEGFAINGLYPHAAWTPDGQDLVIWDDGGLVRVDGQTGAARPIPFEARVQLDLAESLHAAWPVARGEEVRARMIRWPEVSPDGQRVVFEAFGRLWLQGVDEAAATPLTDGAHRALAPSWSPDGQRVIYATWHDTEQGSVRVLDLASRQETRLTERPAQYLAPSFAPDGQTVAWLRGSGAPLRGHGTHEELWFRLETHGSEGVRDVMAHGGSFGSERADNIGWSADGQRILLVEDEPQSAPNSHSRTVLVSVDRSGHDRRVLARWDRATEVAVSPDGRRVAWTEEHAVFSAPLPPLGGQTLELGPKDGAVQVQAESAGSGAWPGWSGEQLTWSLGPSLHIGDRQIELVAALPRARAQGLVAYTNARVLTMGPQGVLERATVVVDGERIVAVGSAPPPAGAKVVDLAGKTLMPGLIDVHAHLHYSASDAQPLSSWQHEANLAYGVTTVHDPSAHDDTVFATAERIEAGLQLGPRVFSTGWILYGAKNKERSLVEDLDDARDHVRRMKALGAVSVKSYQQPARAQRQQVLQAAREEGLNVFPEGGGDLITNLTMLVDGHTCIEHSLPQAPLYDDVVQLYAASGVAYTPTLLVAYGGLAGEHFFYQTEALLQDERFLRFTPEEWVDRAVRRRGVHVNDDDWYHREVALAAARLAEAGVRVNVGGHGQVQGLGVHWELWALGEAMGPARALEAATINGAWSLGMDADLGSVEVGKLADLLVIDGDPLADLRATTNIVEIMKGGQRRSGHDLSALP